MPILLGIDTGGTYTDAVLYDERSGRVVAAAKALTTRHDLAIGIQGAAGSVLEGSGVDPATVALVSLSTTLATNALVEGQGGRVGLVLIGFDEAAASRAGIVDALRGAPCIRIGGGHDAAGRACGTLGLDTLDRAITDLGDPVAAFAVAGMFSVRNPEHEIAVRDRLRVRTGLPVTCGHELSSRLDGPRRAMTCVLNARLVPIIQRLLEAAGRSFDALGVSAPMMVVRGDGALVGAEVARLKPVETILSGPAASLVGASHLTGEREALVSDIGGTTTDYALLVDGRPRIDSDGATVGGFRTMVEAVAMRTVGLGGDSEVRWGSGSERQVRRGPEGEKAGAMGGKRKASAMGAWRRKANAMGNREAWRRRRPTAARRSAPAGAALVCSRPDTRTWWRTPWSGSGRPPVAAAISAGSRCVSMSSNGWAAIRAGASGYSSIVSRPVRLRSTACSNRKRRPVPSNHSSDAAWSCSAE